MNKYVGYTELPSWCIGEINGVHLPKRLELTKPLIYQVMSNGKCVEEIHVQSGSMAEWDDYHGVYIFEETFSNHIISKLDVQMANLHGYWKKGGINYGQ